MVSEAGVIEVPVKPGAKHFGRDLANDIGREVQGAAGAISNAFSSMGKGVALAGAAVGALAAVALTDQFVKALDVDRGRAKLAGQLGLTAEDSARLGKVAGDLYSGAYGDSMQQVNDTLLAVQQNIGDLGSFSDEELKGIGANALSVATAFDVDVNGAVRAAGQLMRNGLAPDAKSAFDILTAGFQQGANTSGDLLETIEEYAPSFASLGLTGEQALGVIAAGLDAGARNGDLAADAFKEFSIRVIDDSPATNAALESLGFNSGEIARQIAGGGPAAATATSQIITALAGIADPIAREAAGVALFGTQFEDLGGEVIAAMDPAKVSLENVGGAADTLGTTLAESTAGKWDAFVRGVQGATQTYIVDSVLPNLETLIQTVGPDLIAAVTGSTSTTSLSAEEMDQRTTEAFGNVADFVTNDLIPAIEALHRADTAVKRFEQASEDASSAIYEAWTGKTLELWQWLINAWADIADNILAAAERAIGWVPGWGEKLETARAGVEAFRRNANTELDAVQRNLQISADTTKAKEEIEKLRRYVESSQTTMKISGVNSVGGFTAGDGPGRPPPGPGGNAHAVVKREIAALGGGMSISSGYRTPARNAAVGGSPTSYHMDRNNPAADVVGPAAKLDQLYARLKRIARRELIWRAPGHYDHLHFAHEGGVVSPSWGTLPGLRDNERPAVLQLGETVVRRGGLTDLGVQIAAAMERQTAELSRAVHGSASWNAQFTVGGLRPDIHGAASYNAQFIVSNLNATLRDLGRPAEAKAAGGSRYIDVGESSGVSRAEVQRLMASGWYSDPTDRQERLYRPFALGGVITQPTRGIVAEAGPEAVIPLDQLGGNLGVTQNNTFTIVTSDPVEAAHRSAWLLRMA